MAVQGAAYNLLTAYSGNSTTGTAVDVRGGIYNCYFDATAFGSGTAAIQVMTPSGVWVNLTGASATANACVPQIYIASGQVRVNLTGATAASVVNVNIVAVPL